MPETWLIDGWNFLHALGVFKTRPANSQKALFDRLAGFASSGNRRVVVVLDGRGNPDELKIHETDSFQVIYSQKVSADTRIERILCENKARVMMRVVTNDRVIGDMARGFGAFPMGTDEFWKLLEETQKDHKEILFKRQAQARGFNRPFEDKLKEP
jgi:predicted RNA-binding protein with PIN domain